MAWRFKIDSSADDADYTDEKNERKRLLPGQIDLAKTE